MARSGSAPIIERPAPALASYDPDDEMDTWERPASLPREEDHARVMRESGPRATASFAMLPPLLVEGERPSALRSRSSSIDGSVFGAVAAVAVATMIGALLLSVRTGGAPRAGVAASEPLLVAAPAAREMEAVPADGRNANARIDQAAAIATVLPGATVSVAGPKNVDHSSPSKGDPPKPVAAAKKVRPRVEAKRSISKIEKELADLQIEQLGR